MKKSLFTSKYARYSPLISRQRAPLERAMGWVLSYFLYFSLFWVPFWAFFHDFSSLKSFQWNLRGVFSEKSLLLALPSSSGPEDDSKTDKEKSRTSKDDKDLLLTKSAMGQEKTEIGRQWVYYISQLQSHQRPSGSCLFIRVRNSDYVKWRGGNPYYDRE